MGEEKNCDTCHFKWGKPHNKCWCFGEPGYPTARYCDAWEAKLETRVKPPEVAEEVQDEEKRCETCGFNPGIGHCLIVKWSGGQGEIPFPVSGSCAAWETKRKGEIPPDLPSPTTSAFISGLINELHDRVGKKAFGQVGLTFVIHEGMVSKYEWTDSTTVKPENGGAK